MALSNWATFAMDETGKPTNGVFNVGNVAVRLYKNWIYVNDTDAWTKDRHYVEPVVMELHDGNLTYKNIEIHAKRGPNEGVYCIVTNAEYPKPKVKVMVGIGCCGYHNEDWVGITKENLDFLRAMMD